MGGSVKLSMTTVSPWRGGGGETPLLFMRRSPPPHADRAGAEGGGEGVGEVGGKRRGLGVRRQMLNDSLKATAQALISSPVCAGCHGN